MAILSFLIPYQIAFKGTWGGYIGTMDILEVFAFFPYFALIMTIAGLVIGIATLRRKKWTWKANVVFQLISIPLIIGSLVALFTTAQEYDFVVVPFQNLFLLVMASVILGLLLRPKTRIDYSPIVK